MKSSFLSKSVQHWPVNTSGRSYKRWLYLQTSARTVHNSSNAICCNDCWAHVWYWLSLKSSYWYRTCDFHDVKRVFVMLGSHYKSKEVSTKDFQQKTFRGRKTDMTDLSDFATRKKTMSLNCILILFNVCEITVVLTVQLSLKFCARYNWWYCCKLVQNFEFLLCVSSPVLLLHVQC